MRAYIRMYLHTYVLVITTAELEYVHTYVYAGIHTYVHTHVHTYVHMYVRMCPHVCIYMYACTYTYTHTHTHTHAHTHTLRCSCGSLYVGISDVKQCQWTPFAEHAIAAFYRLAENPDELAHHLLQQLASIIFDTDTSGSQGEPVGSQGGLVGSQGGPVGSQGESVGEIDEGFDPIGTSTQGWYCTYIWCFTE